MNKITRIDLETLLWALAGAGLLAFVRLVFWLGVKLMEVM